MISWKIIRLAIALFFIMSFFGCRSVSLSSPQGSTYQEELQSLDARIVEFRKVGKPGNALSLARMALSLSEMNTGKESLDTAFRLDVLEEVARKAGQTKEAKQAHDRAYSIRKKLLMAGVSQVRFFESDFEMTPYDKRAYQTQFVRHKTRYIAWELEYSTPKIGKRLDYQLEILWLHNKEIMHRQKKDTHVEGDWTFSWTTWAYGNKKPGEAWDLGQYALEVYLDGKRIVRGEFEVVDSEAMPNHELAGLTTSPGYNYPNENAGKEIYPSADEYYAFSSIARTADNSWILINTPEKKTPAWIAHNRVLFMINEDKLNSLPIYKDLPETDYRYLLEIARIDPPKIDPPKFANPFWGIFIGTVEHHLDAFALPYSEGKTICSLPIGAVVRGVAELPDGDNVIVQADACKKKNVWIRKTDVNWNNVEWWDVNLPIIKPKLSREPTLPKIIKAAKKTKATLPRTRNGMSHTIFIHDTNGGLHDWLQHIPKNWRAKNAAQADILVTIRTIPKFLNSCSYIPLGAFTRVRLDYIVILTLQDPTKLVAEIALSGQEPEECPEQLSVSFTGQSAFLVVGESPDFDRFEKWLKSIVSRRNE